MSYCVIKISKLPLSVNNSITNVSETSSDICTKNNHITWFGPGLLNIISYITIHLKYITLIMRKISMYKNVKTNTCADALINL